MKKVVLVLFVVAVAGAAYGTPMLIGIRFGLTGSEAFGGDWDAYKAYNEFLFESVFLEPWSVDDAMGVVWTVAAFVELRPISLLGLRIELAYDELSAGQRTRWNVARV